MASGGETLPQPSPGPRGNRWPASPRPSCKELEMAQPGQHSGPDVGIMEEAFLPKVNWSQVELYA